MKKFCNMIKSNLYKYMHSAIGIIHIIVPIISIIIFSLILPHYSKNPDIKMNNFSNIICYGYIFMISLIVTVSYEMNQRAGKCQDILSSSLGKLKAHIANIASMAIMSYISLAVALFGYYFVNVFNRNAIITFGVVNTILFVIFFVNIIMYVLQYIICYTFGKGVSIGAGVVFLLMSVLVDVTWANGWKFLPPAYAPKYLDLTVSKIYNEQLSDYLCENYMVSGPVAIIVSVLIIGIFVVWSRKWEGTDYDMD